MSPCQTSPSGHARRLAYLWVAAGLAVLALGALARLAAAQVTPETLEPLRLPVWLTALAIVFAMGAHSVVTIMRGLRSGSDAHASDALLGELRGILHGMGGSIAELKDVLAEHAAVMREIAEKQRSYQEAGVKAMGKVDEIHAVVVGRRGRR